MNNREEVVHIWIFSLRRSGTHVIQDYIMNLTNYPVYNNVALTSLHNIQCEQKGQTYIQTGSKILGVEDHPIQYRHLLEEKAFYEKAIGRATNNIFIYNIRDVYNMASSRIKHWRLMSSEGQTIFDKKSAIGIWEQYADNYVSVVVPNTREYWTKFNNFITDEDYRKELVKFLQTYIPISAEQIQIAENGLNKMNINGNGSSFCHRTNDHEQNQRWKYYIELESFLSLFPPTIQNKNYAIFNTKLGE